MDDEPFEFADQAQTEEQAYELYSVRRIILEMLTDRGYSLPDGDDEKISLPEFKQKFHKKVHKDLTVLAEKATDFEQKIMVFFPIPPVDAKTRRISSEDVKQIHEMMTAQSVRRGIVVVERPLMGHGQLLIEQKTEEQHLQGNTDWRVEVFLTGELRVNITRHELVPTHIVLSDDDKKTLLRRYHLQEKHLPRIQKSDPIARYYGLEHRQVLKIVRPSETAGYYVTYRLVA
mmetsp:Transcript_52062/g.127098  ORF Transcript_52062/g.127098 Transcript_52062/m.127098 type:complete len:231 (-) Transcript_52062:17-709(-)